MTQKPDLEALWHQAVALHQAARPGEAEVIYRQILAANPRFAPAWNLLGLSQLHQNRAGEAVGDFDKAIALQSDFADALFNRAMALWHLGRFAEALDAYDRTLAVNAGHAEAWNYRGGALSFLGRTEDALASFVKATEVKPDYVEALNNRGATEQGLRKFEASLNSFDRALAIQPQHVEVLSNRAVTLSELGRFDEALENVRQALAVKPDNAAALYNEAGLLTGMGKFEEALASYDKTVALQPQYAEAQYNKSLLLLLLGRFETGWPLYEWRKQRKTPMTLRNHAQPHWLGDAEISGKRILLYWEQGLGDTIQFARYARTAAERGAKVFLSVQAPLESLFRQWEPGVTVIGSEETPEAFDYQSSLMSMPLAFGGAVPPAPYLKADSALAQDWAARLGPKKHQRIGICWAGGPAHKNDHNRSIALEEFAALLKPGIEWISLQKDIRSTDLSTFRRHGGIAHYGEEQKDFRDTAALMENLDLVISVDTSVAHLAGALGKPVWVLLAAHPDWRWELTRDDSAWYPGTRLFRQQKPGGWAEVIARIKAQLPV